MSEKIFRIFISSTFSDFKSERNALQKAVFDPLRAFCAERGARFQAIDLRWGISREASRDQRTLEICLAEIDRCQQLTPRPNFILLLGDRYGWCPPPATIPKIEFEHFRQVISAEDMAILNKWYRLDNNACPPEFVLQSWEGLDYEKWLVKESELHKILEKAALKAQLPEKDAFKYWASATHQEAAKGAFSDQAEPEHVFAFFREIKNLPDPECGADFLDTVEEPLGLQMDASARSKLARFKADLRATIPQENIHTYTTSWDGMAPSQQQVDQLCQDMLFQLKGLISDQLSQISEQDPLEAEIAAQEAFAQERCASFTGRGDMLKKIAAHFRERDSGIFVIWGQPGVGKSALMSEAFQQAKIALPEDAVLAARFVSATPESTHPRSLVTSICRQVSRAYGRDEKTLPAADAEIPTFFEEHLSFASNEHPLYLFIDALDQLPGDLSWLPRALPSGVHLVLSTLAGSPRELLADRAPKAVFHQLLPLPDADAKTLMKRWLKEIAGRKLQHDQQHDQQAAVLGNTNPLYLRLAFESARRWHSYDPVPDQPHTIAALIESLFNHLSAENQHGAPLVSRSLGYIAASKNGLAEDELLDLISRDQIVYSWFLKTLFHIPPDLLDWTKEKKGIRSAEAEDWLKETIKDEIQLENFLEILLDENLDLRLPVVLWSRLYADLAPYLAERRGDGTRLLTFYHPTSFGEAVRVRYLTEDEKTTRHQTLAAYFDAQPLALDKGRDNLRKLSELPFQQACGHLWQEVTATLSDLNFLQAKVRTAGTPALIEDYQRVADMGYADSGLDALRKALTMGLFALHKNPTLLLSQLYGRLLGISLPPVAKLLEQIETYPEVWLKPHFPCLTPALSPLQVTIPVGEDVEQIALSPDARWLAALNVDTILTVWDCQTGAQAHFAEFDSPLGDDDRIAISADGRYFLMIVQPDYYSPYHDETLIVYDLETDAEMRPELAEVDGLGYSVDPETGFIAPDWPHRHVSEDQHWVQIKPQGGKSLRITFGAPSDDVYTDSIDGRLHAKPVSDTAVGIFDLSIKSDLPPLTRQEGTIWALAFSPDGTLAAALGDGITIWEVASGSKKAILDLHGTHIAFSPSGRWLVCLGNKLCLYDLAKSQLVYQKPVDLGVVADMVISPDEKQILIVEMTARIRSWSLQTGEELQEVFPYQGIVSGMALTPDGQYAAVCYRDGSIHIWDLQQGGELRSFDSPSNHFVDALTLSPDGALVALCGQKQIFVGETKTGEVRMHLLGDFNAVHLALKQSGERLVTAGSDQRLVVWDVAAGEELAAFAGEEAFTCCAISPDGLTVVGGGTSGGLAFLSLENAPTLSLTVSKTDQEAAEKVYTEGLLWSTRNEYARALDCFNRALALNPNHLNAHHQKIRVLLIIGRDQDALEVISNSLSLPGLEQKDRSKLFHSRGLALFFRDEFKSALTAFQQSAEADPESTAAWFYQGVCNSNLKTWADALVCFQQAYELQQDEKIAVEIIRCYCELAQYYQALDTIVKWETNDSGNPLHTFLVGMVYLKIGQAQRSRAYFEKFIREARPNQRKYIEEANTLSSEIPLAEAPPQEEKSQEPQEDLEEQIQRLNKLLQVGRYQESLDVLDNLLLERMEDPALLMLRAGPLIELGRHEEALAETTRLLDKEDLPVEMKGSIYQFHGLAQMGVEQFQAALESLLVSQQYVESDEISLQIGFLQLRLDQVVEAEVTFRTLEMKGFSAPGVNYGLALVLVSLEQEEEACHYLRRFLASKGPKVEQNRAQAEALLARLCN